METVIVPGSIAAKSNLVVLARRGDQRIPWRRDVDFGVSYGVAPSRGDRDGRDGADACGNDERRDQSGDSRHLSGLLGDNAILYTVLYWLADLRQDVQTDSQSARPCACGAHARGDGDSAPASHTDRRRVAQAGTTGKALTERVATVGKLALFAPLTEDERRAMATELADCMYVRNDTISRRGEAADAMFVLAKGTVAIYGDADSTSGQARPRLATLEAPNYFGEMGLLTGQARTATVVAESDALCYRLDKSGFDAILRARPELVDGLSKVVAERQAANDATLQAADADARARMAKNRASDLVRKIRQFFDIAP